MVLPKPKRYLSKSKSSTIPSTLKKGEPISRNQKAIVVILCAMVITIATVATVRMINTQRNNQQKLEQLIKNGDQIQLQKQNDSVLKLQEQIDELKKQVQIKKQSKIAQVIEKTIPRAQAAGGCQDWMNQAGITDTANAYELIMRESGCNPNAVNKSSGACGIGQQLPCGKWSHTWNEPVGAMIDMQGYVMARYGSWANAVAFHNRMNWY